MDGYHGSSGWQPGQPADEDESVRLRPVAESLPAGPFDEAEPDEDELQSYRYLVELSSQIPWSSDPEGRTIRFNRKWSELTGARNIAAPEDWSEVLHPDEVEPIAAAWARARRTGEALDSEHRLRMRDGSFRWFRTRAAAHRGPDGAILRWYGSTEDVHERKTTELQFRWLAHHDPLTGLANRTLFQKKLAEALERARAGGTELALLVLDLDEFKHVNDQLGHDAGDALLIAFAQTMQAMLPNIARLGGDEFAVLLPRLGSRDAIWETVDAIHAKAKTVTAGELHQGCAVSIGCAIYPEHAADAQRLMTSADIALYEAKDSPPRRARIFESGMRRRLQERASMLSVAGHALENDLVVPFYQPKVNLASGQLEGFEALLRWHHPRLGHQLPATIVAAFEHHALAPALGERMVEKVAADMRRWIALGVGFGRIAVNASSPEIDGYYYAERLLERLRDAGIPPACFEVEVTESVFLGRRADAVERVLRTLSEAGITIALDDFGTGFASLSHLRRFPVDVLKVDQSFIRTLCDEQSDRAIVNAVVGLARGLGIATVAEGVESPEQAARLQSYGCVLGQGYLFGPPVPAADVPATVARLAGRQSLRRSA